VQGVRIFGSKENERKKSTEKFIQNELYYLYLSRNMIWEIMGIWRKMKCSMHIAHMIR
jgi:hypothetical protein